MATPRIGNSFHIDLNALSLDPETSARISTKMGSMILAEVAHLDLSEDTVVVGKLGPGIRGIIAVKALQNLADLAAHDAVKKLG